jgi:cysteinyl-tRNA synthetase
MIQDVFGHSPIDIHGGGLDLKFPHHENEMAQNQALNHNTLANTWVHNGMINIDGIKMSKSLGNVWWAKDLIAMFGGNVVRWVMVSAHYRAPLNLNEETFKNAQKELAKIQNAYSQAVVALQIADADFVKEYDEPAWNAFIEAMNDDLNTPNGISAVFETVKQINQQVRQRELDKQKLAALVYTLEQELYVLGIELDKILLSQEDKELYRAWKAAVKAKDFETADKHRSALKEKGII